MQVLLGIGGGDDAVLALEKTVERVEATDDVLTIAILEHPATDRSAVELLELVDSTVDDDVAVTHLDGAPGPALVEFAERGEFDRLVIGGGLRSPMGKISLGDVAEFVILNAPMSVTLIR